MAAVEEFFFRGTSAGPNPLALAVASEIRDCSCVYSPFSILFSVSSCVNWDVMSVFSLTKMSNLYSSSDFSAFLRSLEACADFLLASNLLAYLSSALALIDRGFFCDTLLDDRDLFREASSETCCSAWS